MHNPCNGYNPTPIQVEIYWSYEDYNELFRLGFGLGMLSRRPSWII
jgi:hypothetical protein